MYTTGFLIALIGLGLWIFNSGKESNPIYQILFMIGMGIYAYCVLTADAQLDYKLASAMRDMIDKMNNGGKIALLGIAPTEFAVDWNKIIFKMLQVKGIYGREIFETWYKMIAMVQSGLDLSGLITHRITAEEFEIGFSHMLSGEAGKVVMDWT